MLLSLIKVQGHSMEPFLKEGSFFIGSNLPYLFSKPKTGDVVLFKIESKLIVKKVYKIDENKIYVEGINKNDSKYFAPLERSKILGKLIIKL